MAILSRIHRSQKGSEMPTKPCGAKANILISKGGEGRIEAIQAP